MSSLQSVTSAFVDLATYDELDKFQYGGSSAVSYFVREHMKSSWFSQIPTSLSLSNGQPDFGNTFEANISRAGDYLLQTWIQVVIPSWQVGGLAQSGAETGTRPSDAAAATNLTVANGSAAYIAKLGHNLVKEAKITFNDLTAARLSSEFLDFYYQYYVTASKKVGYANMIGDTTAVTGLQAPAATVTIPATRLYIPLPFFYAQDSGVALPVAALPYNQMKISITFRTYQELVSCAYTYAGGVAASHNLSATSNAVSLLPSGGTYNPAVSGTAPSLNGAVSVWANYAIVSNQERRSMGCVARDMLIEQLQIAPQQNVNSGTATSLSVDIRFSHSVKALMFALRNVDPQNPQLSNYTCLWGRYAAVAAGQTPDLGGANPVNTASLVYENTQRLSSLDAAYYSLVNPFFASRAVAEETGYHVYSYALDLQAVDPCGSTNYSKLSNVSLTMNLSTNATAGVNANTESAIRQTYQAQILAVNKNVIRISGGALGFPVM